MIKVPCALGSWRLAGRALCLWGVLLLVLSRARRALVSVCLLQFLNCLLVVTCAPVLQHGVQRPSGRYTLHKRDVELAGAAHALSVQQGMRLQPAGRHLHRAVAWCMLNMIHCTILSMSDRLMHALRCQNSKAARAGAWIWVRADSSSCWHQPTKQGSCRALAPWLRGRLSIKRPPWTRHLRTAHSLVSIAPPHM